MEDPGGLKRLRSSGAFPRSNRQAGRWGGLNAYSGRDKGVGGVALAKVEGDTRRRSRDDGRCVGRGESG